MYIGGPWPPPIFFLGGGGTQTIGGALKFYEKIKNFTKKFKKLKIFNKIINNLINIKKLTRILTLRATLYLLYSLCHWGILVPQQ